jgi:transcriptional regulator with XRE-family HTH domain
MKFWERVKNEVKAQNTTQEWLAKKADIIPGTIKQQIHHNRLPDVEQGQKMAIALGVTVEYLVTGKPPAGLPEDILAIARAAERLSPEGRKVALHQVEALAVDFPCESSVSSKRA